MLLATYKCHHAPQSSTSAHVRKPRSKGHAQKARGLRSRSLGTVRCHKVLACAVVCNLAVRWLADRLRRKSVTNPDSHLVFRAGQKSVLRSAGRSRQRRPLRRLSSKTQPTHTWLGAHYKYHGTTLCLTIVHKQVEIPLVQMSARSAKCQPPSCRDRVLTFT